MEIGADWQTIVLGTTFCLLVALLCILLDDAMDAQANVDAQPDKDNIPSPRASKRELEFDAENPVSSFATIET